MEEKQENSIFSRRRFFWRVLAVLMFFYLCADVTVLEYFGGNVSLAIASYRQVVETNSQPAKLSQTAFARNTTDVSRSSKRDRETEIPWDGDDCFCSSSHAVISYNYSVVSLVPVFYPQRDPSFPNQKNHSNWHLPASYRPPRIA